MSSSQPPQTYAAGSSTETPRLTVIPQDDGEPVLDSREDDILLDDCTEVVNSIGNHTQTYYKFTLWFKGYPQRKRPDISERDAVQMVYSAGLTAISLYGGQSTSDDEGEIATVSGYLDEKSYTRWTVVTQQMPSDNPIADVHSIAEP